MKASTNISIVASPTESVQLSQIERFADESGYGSVIDVKSGEFSCVGRKFIFGNLAEFKSDLENCFSSLSGHAQLKTPYEEEFLKIEFLSGGHIAISGLLRDSGGKNQKLFFEFSADQTFVPALIASTKKVLSETD